MRIRPAVVFLVASWMVAACGAEGSYSPARPSLTEERLDADEGQPALIDQLRRFATCMRGKGVDFADPEEADGEGAGDYIKENSRPGDPTFESADDACRIEVFGEADGGPGGERGGEEE